MWRREDSGASGNQEGLEKLEARPLESKREEREKVWSSFPLCKQSVCAPVPGLRERELCACGNS